MSNEELAIAIQQGEEGRTLELWEQVNGLVKRKAMQIMTALQLSGNPRGVEFDDLYQTGYLAMVAAVETYSPERGAFSTWFMFHLKTAFAEATGYRTKNGRCEPLNTAASLDRPVQPDEPDGGTLGELVPDSRAADAIDNVEESVYHEQLHKAIDGAISELPPGNAQWDDMTLSAVGEVMGKSPERTRQMENKGIRELRKSRTLHRFLDFDMYHGTGLGAFRLSGSSIQEQYILKQERREEYERKRRNEQAFENETEAMTRRVAARVASMSPEEKRAMLERAGITVTT